MGGYQQGMGEREKERGGQGQRTPGPCCSRILIFNWDLINLSSSMPLVFSRAFHALPFLIEYVITGENTKVNEGGQLYYQSHCPHTLHSSLRVSIFSWWYKQCWQIADKTK